MDACVFRRQTCPVPALAVESANDVVGSSWANVEQTDSQHRRCPTIPDVPVKHFLPCVPVVRCSRVVSQCFLESRLLCVGEARQDFSQPLYQLEIPTDRTEVTSFM